MFILSLAISVNAQTSEFTEATGSGTAEIGDFSKWNFEIGASEFEINNDGKGKRKNAKNSAVAFRLPLGKDELISNKLYFASYKKDIVFLYEASIGGEGLGYIASFDSAALKPKWKAQISGFNVGQGLIENQFVYLTAIGFVAKLNLTTGKYVWKHSNLYGWNKNDGAFNSFELPELEGNNVIFTEKTVDNQTNIIVVNKISGKIIRTVAESSGSPSVNARRTFAKRTLH